MVEMDKEISNKIDGINYQLHQVESSIKIKKILTSNITNIVLFFILILHTCIFGKGLYYYISNIFIFSLFILLEFLLGIAIISIIEKELEESMKILKDKDNNLKETKEKILNFSYYIVACRHIESIKYKRKDIYPEQRYNDSVYVYNKFKDIYEEKRIRYEDGERTQILYELTSEI